MYKILSLSGGGIRGIITATILRKIEQATEKRIIDQFDLIVGTSTGGILAAALCQGFSPLQILNLYFDEGDTIFSRSLGWKIKSLGGLTNSKYDGKGLRQVITDYFADYKFKDSKVPLITTSYNTLKQDVILFKSWKEEWQDAKMSDVALATSSAPTYFPPYIYKDMSLIDGGIYANSPVEIGWIEGIKAGHKFEDIKILSVGTGISQKAFQTDNWGMKEWLVKSGYNPLLDMIFSSSSEKDDYITERIFEKNYMSINPLLEKRFAKMDNSEEDNGTVLYNYAAKEFKDQEDKILEFLK